jgi:hypothetical protein
VLLGLLQHSLVATEQLQAYRHCRATMRMSGARQL